MMQKEFEISYKSTGLTDLEVQEKTKQGKINKIYTKTSKTYFQIFISNFFTWFNLICFVIAGTLIAIKSYENILFIVIFLCNLFIGLFQEIKAKKIVDKISVFVEKKVDVLRNGKQLKIDIDKVVEGDVLFFHAGDQICCDCKLIEGQIEANESLLTGESKPLKKNLCDSLLGGSFVVSGECMAVAEKVGMENYSSTLIKKARELKQNKSEILKTLNLIIKTIGFLLIPLGILTFFDLKNNGLGLNNALIKTSGSIIGMMPVGMFLLTSVSLVVGVIKLARRNTLVQDLYSIEMLARADVLCLDKTGTITDGTMKVLNVFCIKQTNEEIKKIMSSILSATKSNNQTQIALQNYFQSKNTIKAKDVINFSSERKFSAATFEDGKTYILGAPEFSCKKIDKKLSEQIKEFTKNGLRVILLCQNKNKISNQNITVNSVPIAIITIQDNIRDDAEETIKWFNDNGVQIKIISGDNVDTVSTIAKKVGVKNADKCVSLDGKSDDEVIKFALTHNIFGRVSPEQKCLIVKTLKKNGLKVAMTGDGVNDILALKESDCSIAMASGSEATRSASNLVMLDSNFSSMPCIVAEGRRVINNISKASSLFLTKTFFTIFLTIFVLISPSYQFPLQPNQLLLWETFFIGIPAFLLALQSSNEKIHSSFLASLSSKAIPGALVLFLATMSSYVFCAITKNMSASTTLISYSITFGAFCILFNLCLPFDKYRSLIVSSMLVGCLICFLVIPNTFFNYINLTLPSLIFLVINIVSCYILYAVFKFLLEKLFKIKK